MGIDLSNSSETRVEDVESHAMAYNVNEAVAEDTASASVRTALALNINETAEEDDDSE